MKGVFYKRLYYFFASLCRLIGFLATLIGYIVVKIVVKPSIAWLNGLLLYLSIAGLVSGILLLLMCGMTVRNYKHNKFRQIVILIITIITGGLFGTIFSSFALGTRLTDEDMENESMMRKLGDKNDKEEK